MTGTQDEQDDLAPGRWRADIDRLTAELCAYLGQELSEVKLIERIDSYSCTVRGPAPTDDHIQLAVEAVFGMQDIDGEREVWGSLFLFSHGHRLRLAGDPGSYLVLHHSDRWETKGWESDGFGEYDDFETFGVN